MALSKSMLKELATGALNVQRKRHVKCKGYNIPSVDGEDFDCGYGSMLACDECKYGGLGGRKDPEAKRNAV